MVKLQGRLSWLLWVNAFAGLGLLLLSVVRAEPTAAPGSDFQGEFGKDIQPLLKKFCLDCHSTSAKKGSLDLERFVSVEQIRKDLKPWQQTIEMLEAEEMPPRARPQPTAAQRKQLINWIHGFLDAEARSRAGDPGFVPLRRLSNAEYDWTIRDLTGVDLKPTREFPADGAGGEGFTNAAESLTEISPALLTKYLNAAKEIAEHVYLLPDGFRFSIGKTRRDWTNESIARLQKAYSDFAPEGRLPLEPYLRATIRHRDRLREGDSAIADIAAREKLNHRYLATLWQVLNDPTPSHPLDLIRARWRQARESDLPGLMSEIGEWRNRLWQIVPIGSYRYNNTERQAPVDPVVKDSQTVRLELKPDPGQSEVVIQLVATNIGSKDPSGDVPGKGLVIWDRPRFEKAGKPALLLCDYDQYGPAYEFDLAELFDATPRYLDAVAQLARNPMLTIEKLAQRQGIQEPLLKRWVELLALQPPQAGSTDPEKVGRRVTCEPLELLGEKSPPGERPAIKGWRKKGIDLPQVLSNASDKVEHIPGKAGAHQIVVHPTPTEFVAVTWKSPKAATVRISARIQHAHPSCGNGVAWWIQHRRDDRALLLDEGAVNLGGEAVPPAKVITVAQDDLLVLAVDARNGDHVCDLTEIAFTIQDTAPNGKTWDLSRDVADTINAGNPHADSLGNKEIWSFVKGPSRPTTAGATGTAIPVASLLGQWRTIALDSTKQTEAKNLADRVRKLLVSPRPAGDANPDRTVFDLLESLEGPLLKGLPWKQMTRPMERVLPLGIGKDKFGTHASGKTTNPASLLVPVNSIIGIRLPASLLREYTFVADGRIDRETAPDSLVRFQLGTKLSGHAGYDPKIPLVGDPKGKAYQRVVAGLHDFRRIFPLFVCFPQIVPTDEVVTLKMYHREDEPLYRLFADATQKAQLDHLWEEHQFIGQQPRAENKYLPLFIGFVTQDQPRELLDYFEGQRPIFQKRADTFEKALEAAIPRQLAALEAFAARAFRRPLRPAEIQGLRELYQTLRTKESSHEEAFRAVLARILIAPAFLFHIEAAPLGPNPGPINNWELASRLSYFLTSSAPDDELRRLAQEGKLVNPDVLAQQTRRLLKDERIRALAIEFGTQWLHVRAFDTLKEKNEKLFPSFDTALRQAINEESILFFQDLFQADRPLTSLLDSDATFLNETLAKHYGIPGVSGPHWRRVEGIKAHGRGGILGLASVQASQSGASRTSPVLRGNWVVETLLGEKLPRPPANVPQLPEEEGASAGLTTRQLVEKHARVAECAVCHQRIDPFGFALENYDPIGRRRDREIGGLPVDATARLRDGTEFAGIEGLRHYLLTRKKEVLVRLFCRKLLGYALGRSASLSDQALIEEMTTALNREGGKVSDAVLAIVRSPQFLRIRGSDHGDS